MQTRLRVRWEQLWQRLGKPAPLQHFETLMRMYQEPHRAYHTLTHIAHGLDEFDEVRQLLTYPEAVELAFWFHDCVYDTTRHDNEERSAAYAKSVLVEAGLPAELVRWVVELIMATTHRAPAEGKEASYLVDIDLSILGQAPEVFDFYEVGIRDEYSWVPDEAFRTRRIALLEQFLARPSIYQTAHFKEKYEAAARANMLRSLRKLHH